MTPREMVVAIDWSKLPHNYGHEPNVLAVWDVDIEGNEAACERTKNETLGNLVCHQGTISPAAFALVKPLLHVAKSTHPRRNEAIHTLADFLDAYHGLEGYRALLGERLAYVPNPFKKGERLGKGEPPDEEVIAAERAAMTAMRQEIEGEFDFWMEVAKAEGLDWGVRLASLHLLARVTEHPQADEAEELVRFAYASLDGERRESLAWLIEDLDLRYREGDEEE